MSGYRPYGYTDRPAPLFREGTTVETTRHLRRLGRDIPPGTRGVITRDVTERMPYSETRIKTDCGAFVVAPAEYRVVTS